MGITTNISWTDRSWNPWQGCHRASAGCKHCYMFREKKMYGQEPEDVHLSTEHTFNQPKSNKWKDPAKVFVCSWSDFFIEEADMWRPAAWQMIKETPHLTYQILTKRASRILKNLPEDWGDGYPNVWLGVTTENQKTAEKRIPMLLRVPAAVRFLSVEPMLSPVTLWTPEIGEWPTEKPTYPIANVQEYDDWKYWMTRMRGINWVIIGAESGYNCGATELRRAMELDWARSLLNQCKHVGVPTFIKQVYLPTDKGPRLSKDPMEWPEDLRVREFPTAGPFGA